MQLNGWNTPPLKLVTDEKYAYGLGVCDMKGGISAFLKACSSINKSKLKNGIKLYFTFDEEIDFEGIKLLTKNNEEFPKYLILSEPTDLQPVVATKGCMEVKITFYGKSAHSSTPDKGKNAILEAYRFIGEILEFYEELKKQKNYMFSIPYTTINIGTIKGGDSVNKIPDKCVLKLDARTISERHNIKIEEKIKKILENYDSKYEIKININTTINDDNEMITTIENLCKNKRKSENYVTEASFIENSETVILGLGPVTSHQCNEFIEIEKLNKLVEIYKKIIKKYCY